MRAEAGSDHWVVRGWALMRLSVVEQKTVTPFIAIIALLVGLAIGWGTSDRYDPRPWLQLISKVLLPNQYTQAAKGVLGSWDQRGPAFPDSAREARRIRVWEDQDHPWPEAVRRRLQRTGVWAGQASLAGLDALGKAAPTEEVWVVASWEPRGPSGQWLLQFQGAEALLGSADQRVRAWLIDAPARQQWEEKTHPVPLSERPPVIRLAPVQPEEEARRLHGIAHYTVALLLGWWCLGTASFTGTLLGANWMLERKKGELESYALVPGPLWLWYGSQIGVALFHWWVGIAALLLGLWAGWPASVFGPFFVFMVPLWGLGSIMLVNAALFSILTAMFFHHPWGRQAAYLLLWPVELLLAFTSRGAFLLGMGWSTLLFGIQPSLPSTAWVWALAAVQTTLVGPLVWGIERRIGRRREGLRELV